MGFFPELDELEQRLCAAAPDADAELWFEEVAVTLRKVDPDAGAAFLHDHAAAAEPDRLAGMLLGITWFGPADADAAEPLLLEALVHGAPEVAASAIDGLARTGHRDVADRVLALVDDPRPRVRGAVLRYACRVAPDRALPLLLAALDDADYTVRGNAVDELAELEAVEAWPAIAALRHDPHPLVRGFVVWAAAALAPASEAETLVQAALRDEDAEVRRSAEEVLPLIHR